MTITMPTTKLKTKKVKNSRLDIVSHQYYDKTSMLRIVRMKNRLVKIDVLQNIDGKGAYFQLSIANVILITQKRLLNRALKTKINKSFYQELLIYAKENCDNDGSSS